MRAKYAQAFVVYVVYEMIKRCLEVVLWNAHVGLWSFGLIGGWSKHKNFCHLHEFMKMGFFKY